MKPLRRVVLEFAEWRGQGRPPVQGVSLSIGGAGAVMTDSSKRAALPQAGVGAVVPLAAAKDQGIRKSQSLSMSSAPVHALASPIKRCRKISAFINVSPLNQRQTRPRRPVSPGNLSFYQCFTTQPGGSRRRQVKAGKSQSLSMFPRGLRIFRRLEYRCPNCPSRRNSGVRRMRLSVAGMS